MSTDLFSMLAGWKNEPIRLALQTLAIAKFGESSNQKYYDNGVVDTRLNDGPTKDFRANYMLSQFSGAIPAYSPLGKLRVFNRVVLMNALYQYIMYDIDPTIAIQKYNAIDKMFYPDRLNIILIELQ